MDLFSTRKRNLSGTIIGAGQPESIASFFRRGGDPAAGRLGEESFLNYHSKSSRNEQRQFQPNPHIAKMKAERLDVPVSWPHNGAKGIAPSAVFREKGMDQLWAPWRL